MSVTAVDTPPIWFIDNLAYVRVSGEETDDRLSIVELAGPGGHMPPLHIHHREDEGFVVLEGELTVYVGGDVLTLRAGESALGPMGVPHTFRVESETARWLAICSPGGFERFVAEVGKPATAAVIPDDPVMPSPDRLGEIATEYGIELLGPPGMLPS